ncbi:hypothetical protein CALVIDRAFT_603147 [Calocera viscosa TUFC12733]|uniref:Uncharacterized protein n=1 Tax=Calocera viscosa (strain TUFC12733) TaxID=1330018 RepID=A0A167G543_CALVF|nr:hypothetical protein CALVIDRAFT_603147 [Calocera viscosa TUFC12733]
MPPRTQSFEAAEEELLQNAENAARVLQAHLQHVLKAGLIDLVDVGRLPCNLPALGSLMETVFARGIGPYVSHLMLWCWRALGQERHLPADAKKTIAALFHYASKNKLSIGLYRELSLLYDDMSWETDVVSLDWMRSQDPDPPHIAVLPWVSPGTLCLRDAWLDLSSQLGDVMPWECRTSKAPHWHTWLGLTMCCFWSGLCTALLHLSSAELVLDEQMVLVPILKALIQHCLEVHHDLAVPTIHPALALSLYDVHCALARLTQAPIAASLDSTPKEAKILVGLVLSATSTIAAEAVRQQLLQRHVEQVGAWLARYYLEYRRGYLLNSQLRALVDHHIVCLIAEARVYRVDIPELRQMMHDYCKLRRLGEPKKTWFSLLSDKTLAEFCQYYNVPPEEDNLNAPFFSSDAARKEYDTSRSFFENPEITSPTYQPRLPSAIDWMAGDNAAPELPPIMHSASAAPNASMKRIGPPLDRHPAAVEPSPNMVIRGVAPQNKPSTSKLEPPAVSPPLMVTPRVVPNTSSKPRIISRPDVAGHIEVSLAGLPPQKAKGMVLIAQEIEDAIGAVESRELEAALEAGEDGLAIFKKWEPIFRS